MIFKTNHIYFNDNKNLFVYNDFAMDKTIIEKAYELKKLLNEDERVKKLNSLEEKMNNDDQVILLAYKKDMAADKYAEMVRLFKDDSEEANNARKELSLAKANLDKNPLVMEYTKAFREVRKLYEEINAELFSDLNPSLCPKEHK